jgi:WD40 repeat protein
LRLAAAEHGSVVGAIHRALRAEAHHLRANPSDLAARIHDHLRSQCWEPERIARELRFPAGLPRFRLRHTTRHPSEELTLEGHEAGVWACSVSPDGRRLVSASRDKTLRVWDLHSGEGLAVLRGHDREVRDCVVMPDGRRVVSASADATLRIWDIETGEVLATLAGHKARVLACAVSADGRRIVSASSDRTLRVWDPAKRDALAILSGHAHEVRDCAVTPDGLRVVSVSPGELKLWSCESGKEIAHWASEVSGDGCALNPDGSIVVVGADAGHGLYVWDLNRHEQIASFSAGGDRRADRMRNCVVTADGRRVIGTSTDRTVRVWELATGHELARLDVYDHFGHRDIVLMCALAPDGQHVVNASWDRTLRVWNLDACRAIPTETRLSKLLELDACLTSTTDGRRAVGLDSEGDLQVRSLDTGKVLATFALEGKPANTIMAIGRRRAVVTAGGDLRAFDVETGAEIARLVNRDYSIGSHAVAEGDRWVVVHDPQERHIRVWDLETSQLLTVAQARRLGYVLAAAHRCAVFHERTVAVWDEGAVLRSTFDLPANFRLREWRTTSDGRYLVTASTDLQVRYHNEQVHVWELASGRPIVVLARSDPPGWPFLALASCAVTPDARQLVTGSLRDRIIGVWDLQTGAPIASIPIDAGVCNVTTTNDVICASDYFGHVWIYEDASRAGI